MIRTNRRTVAICLTIGLLASTQSFAQNRPGGGPWQVGTIDHDVIILADSPTDWVELLAMARLNPAVGMVPKIVIDGDLEINGGELVIPTSAFIVARGVYLKEGGILRVEGDLQMEATVFDGRFGTVITRGRAKSSCGARDGSPGAKGADGIDGFRCKGSDRHGRPGKPGTNGQIGEDGADGARGASYSAFFVFFYGINHDGRGDDGCDAGNGGRGGDGGDGGDGKTCVTNSGDGGDGGNGGNGGRGGNGGDAGPGGDLRIVYCQDHSFGNVRVDLRAGSPGHRGDGGGRGTGGAGGAGGGFFPGAPDGDPGDDGLGGPDGIPGNGAADGTATIGPAPSWYPCPA